MIPHLILCLHNNLLNLCCWNGCSFSVCSWLAGSRSFFVLLGVPLLVSVYVGRKHSQNKFISHHQPITHPPRNSHFHRQNHPYKQLSINPIPQRNPPTHQPIDPSPSSHLIILTLPQPRTHPKKSLNPSSLPLFYLPGFLHTQLLDATSPFQAEEHSVGIDSGNPVGRW